jgi:hypothetical protein
VSTPWAPFPDVEVAVLDLLAATFPNNGTVTPADFTDVLPFVRVNRYGGTDDRITDAASVAVDVFSDHRSGARDGAEQVRQLLLAGPHAVDGAVLDRVTTVSAPVEASWDNPAIRRWTATYRVTARRPVAAS